MKTKWKRDKKKKVWMSLVVCSNMKPKFLIDKVSYMMILERLSLLFHIVSFSVLHSNFSLMCFPVSHIKHQNDHKSYHHFLSAEKLSCNNKFMSRSNLNWDDEKYPTWSLKWLLLSLNPLTYSWKIWAVHVPALKPKES